MDEQDLNKQIDEIIGTFGDKSPEPQHPKLAKLADQVKKNRKKLQKSLDELQESLDYLRVCIKYQAFDLEATRRENARLRELLEGEE
jgi:predicted  nucleic acid-binding Zn-ribbon protein